MNNMNKVINNSTQPVVLGSGVVMGASGTVGSIREDVELSERDRKRYVRPDMLVVIETTTTAAQPESETVLTPTSEAKKEKK